MGRQHPRALRWGLSGPLPASLWEGGDQRQPHGVPKKGLPSWTVSVLGVGAGLPPTSGSFGPRMQWCLICAHPSNAQA